MNSLWLESVPDLATAVSPAGTGSRHEREACSNTLPAQLTPAGDNIRKLISLWGDRRGYYSFTSEIRSIQYPVRALYVHPPRPRPDNISLVEKFSNLFARKPQVSEQKETVW